MKKLMTKHFSKWANKQKIPKKELSNSLDEVQAGNFEANLGGNLYKKRIHFEGQGKSGGGIILKYSKWFGKSAMNGGTVSFAPG